MRKVIQLKYTGLLFSKYVTHTTDGVGFCAGMAQSYFALERKACTMVLTTTKPRDNDYYQLRRRGRSRYWEFDKSEVKARGLNDSSPWLGSFDGLLSVFFKGENVVYVYLLQ